MMALFVRTKRAEPVLLTVLPKCGLCGIKDMGCRSPLMPPTGKGKKRILVVGEAPGEEEDNRNRQFVGVSGKLLRDAIQDLGFDPDRDCTFTNSLICRPPKNKIRDMKAIEYCRPNLLNTIKAMNPIVVLLLGAKPVRSLIGHLWKEETKGIRRWAGFRIPCRNPNAWICPTYHPAYLLREERNPNYPVLKMKWLEHLEAALSLTERPWKHVPNYRQQVVPIQDPDKAAVLIKAMAFSAENMGVPIAFDYETTCLKPEHPKSRIVCCSVSDGINSIAFPWTGKVIDQVATLLKNPKLKKVGQNCKFEDRWTREKLGFHVRGWIHDDMLTAHGLDCRKEITGLKFQAFVQLGQESYDDAIKPYLQSRDGGGYGLNRIHKVPINDLLIYCGQDSLLEWKLWEKQRKVLGF